MNKIGRREFVKHAGATAAVGAGAVLTGCQPKQQTSALGVVTKKQYEWKMVTTWPPHFKVMGEGADMLAEWVERMSEGRLKITVYGANELVPALSVFDAVRQGSAEIGHGAAYYWAGKAKATQFFAAVPFGMNAQQMNAWIYAGGGLELWQEVYAPFDLMPMPAGNTGVQMGGWFNREINSVDDLKGLKMRIPGLGGKVIKKAGGAAILSAGGEIYMNLERGVIDATEWVGPYHDYLMGFHKIAKYYYYPGWHEPGTVLEMFVNKKAFESLPADLQEILKTAAFRSNVGMLSTFESKNNSYLQKLINEHHVQLRRFPDAVLAKLREYSGEVIEEICEDDAMSRKVYKSFHKFQQQVSRWADVSEKSYYGVLLS